MNNHINIFYFIVFVNNANLTAYKLQFFFINRNLVRRPTLSQATGLNLIVSRLLQYSFRDLVHFYPPTIPYIHSISIRISFIITVSF